MRKGTYTGMVVEMCTVSAMSAMSATLIRRNMGGPWCEEPSVVAKGTEPKVEDKRVPLEVGADSGFDTGWASFSAFFVILEGWR